MKTNWNACRKLLPRHAPARNGRNLEGCTALASHLGKSETKSQMIVDQRFLIARAFRRPRRLHLLSHARIIACEIILDSEAEFVASPASLGYREDDGSSGPRHAVPNVFGVSVTATRRNRRLPGGRQPASLRVAHTTSAASACAGAESRAISPTGRNHATVAGSARGKRP